MKISFNEKPDYWIEVVEESPNYYISSSQTVYPKMKWTKIPFWRDVTSELVISDFAPNKHLDYPGFVSHGGKTIAKLICGGQYRIRMDDGKIVVEMKS